MVPYELINCKQTLRIVPTEQQFLAANSTPIQVTGKVVLPLRLNGRLIQTTAYVSRDISEIILGSDCLRQYKCVWVGLWPKPYLGEWFLRSSFV